jgi:hypothetical protein
LHFLSHWLGLDNASGALYLFWSGFFGDGPIIVALGAIWWRHNCHQKGCWRIARQQIDGSTHYVCHKHHPTGARTDTGAL